MESRATEIVWSIVGYFIDTNNLPLFSVQKGKRHSKIMSAFEYG